MAIKIPFGGYEGLWERMSQFSDILRRSNIENLGRLTDSITKTIEPSIAVAEIVGRQAQLLSSLNIPSYTQNLAVSAVEEQLKLLATDGMLVIGKGFVLVGFKESEWIEVL